jgi:hypothetical protein
MSKYSESFAVAAGPGELGQQIPQLAARAGWRVANQVIGPDSAQVSVKQPFKLLSFTWPVSVEVRATGNGQGSNVELRGSNFGFGPIQTAKVRTEVQGLRAAIESGAGRPA